MPKVTYTPSKGLVQEAGSGFSITDSVVTADAGVTNNSLIAGFIPNAAPTQSTTGAVSVASYFTSLSITNTIAFTLANGTAVGQLKKIMCAAVSGTPVGNLTIASPVSAALDVIQFTALGDTADLIWTGTAWRILGLYNVASGNTTTPTVS